MRIANKQINEKDKLDAVEVRNIFNKLDIPFKNGSIRDKERIYINQSKKCENVNAFAHKINHITIDREPTAYTISPEKSHYGKELMYQVPPCVLERNECTVENRKRAKAVHHQAFRSVMKMGESYFKARGLSMDTHY